MTTIRSTETVNTLFDTIFTPSAADETAIQIASQLNETRKDIVTKMLKDPSLSNFQRIERLYNMLKGYYVKSQCIILLQIAGYLGSGKAYYQLAEEASLDNTDLLKKISYWQLASLYREKTKQQQNYLELMSYQISNEQTFISQQDSFIALRAKLNEQINIASGKENALQETINLGLNEFSYNRTIRTIQSLRAQQNPLILADEFLSSIVNTELAIMKQWETINKIKIRRDSNIRQKSVKDPDQPGSIYHPFRHGRKTLQKYSTLTPSEKNEVKSGWITFTEKHPEKTKALQTLKMERLTYLEVNLTAALAHVFRELMEGEMKRYQPSQLSVCGIFGITGKCLQELTSEENGFVPSIWDDEDIATP